MECDVILPNGQNGFPNGDHLAALLEQPRGPIEGLKVFERGVDNVVIKIGTASLV